MERAHDVRNVRARSRPAGQRHGLLVCTARVALDTKSTGARSPADPEICPILLSCGPPGVKHPEMAGSPRTRPILNDHWTLDIEAFGARETAEGLARLILTCRPPFAVCVQGKWGAGKTSVMRYAMAKLGGHPMGLDSKPRPGEASELPAWLTEPWQRLNEAAPRFIQGEFARIVSGAVEPSQINVQPIWFNPWQHGDRTELIIALLQEIRAHFAWELKAWEQGKKLACVTLEAGLSLLDKVAHGVFADVTKKGEAYEKRHFDHPSEAQRLALMFERSVVTLLRGTEHQQHAPKELSDGHGNPFPTRRLVIFIDDLDRCNEPQALALLDAVKLYLHIPQCVFIFGLDSFAIRSALVRQSPGWSREDAKAYVDKMFQATTYVPVPRGRTAYLRQLLEVAGCPALHDDREFDRLAELIDQLCEPNPRRLKGFVVSLASAWAATGSQSPPSLRDATDFVLMHYLQQVHPEVFRLVAYDPNNLQVLARVLAEIGESENVLITNAIASPVGVMIAHAFRHAVDKSYLREEDYRGDLDRVADEVNRRLDRHKGDRAFLSCWREHFAETTAEDMAERLQPLVTGPARETTEETP